MFSRLSGMFSMNPPNGNIPRPRAFSHRNNNNPAVDVGRAAMGHARRSSLDYGQTQKKHCSRSPPGTTDPSSEVRTCLVDNSLAVIEKIASLYAEKLMSDITLVINGIEFPAHRLILCSSSDVFQVMLMNPNWTESQENRVVLQESPECTEFFEGFLKYLYTGRLKLDLTNVMHLLTLGDKYNVKDLIALCLEYMQYHIPAAAHQSQLVNWFQHTSNCGHYHVADMCKNFIKWNFDLVAKADDFPLLDLDLMVSILSDDDIVVEDEYTLFQYLVYWIDCQRSKFSAEDPELETNMFQIMQQSIELIRFPMMAPRQLADMLLCPLTQKYKEFLMEKMAIGMAFHSGVVERIYAMAESHPNRTKLFTSRLYCTDTWSVCLVIDKFSALNHYQSKTLVFSTPISVSERYSEKQIEWVVDFYPKGIWFNKGLLIVWQGTLECPEYVMQTVRLSLNCKSDENTEVRVQIGILITGCQDGVEHIRSVSRKNYIFSGRDKVLNIDDVLSYDELTPCASCKTNASGRPDSNNAGPRCSRHHHDQGGELASCFAASERSCFLVGETNDSLKIRIVITPMSELYF